MVFCKCIYTKVPKYCTRASKYLNRNSQRSTSFVVQSANLSQYWSHIHLLQSGQGFNRTNILIIVPKPNTPMHLMSPTDSCEMKEFLGFIRALFPILWKGFLKEAFTSTSTSCSKISSSARPKKVTDYLFITIFIFPILFAILFSYLIIRI